MKMNWIITELYYPEETSTGYFLTKIAEGLAQHNKVSAICSQPTYSQRDLTAPKFEIHKGVHVYRCWGGRLDKNFLPFRIINFLTISFSLLFKSLVLLKRGDKVMVVTNPPLLPYLILLACKIKRCPSILLVHDIYPEVLVATRIFRSNAIFVKMISGLTSWLYNQVNVVIVIGRDMKGIVLNKCANANKVVLITNWADLDIVRPLLREESSVLKSQSLGNSFVVQYCGNMGRTHGLEYLVEAAEKMQSVTDVHFLLMGSGARLGWLKSRVVELMLGNVTVLSRCSRDELNNFLNACDIAVISFVPGMKGVSVPSRMYNIMAAGKPILAITDADSELAMVVREENIGWVVEPGNIEGIIGAIRDAQSAPARLIDMGLRARKVAIEKYSLDKTLDQYQRLLDSL